MKEEIYEITPKGLLMMAFETNPSVDRIWETLELYCYRHKYNAILINENGGLFINVEKEKPKKKRKK